MEKSSETHIGELLGTYATAVVASVERNDEESLKALVQARQDIIRHFVEGRFEISPVFDPDIEKKSDQEFTNRAIELLEQAVAEIDRLQRAIPMERLAMFDDVMALIGPYRSNRDVVMQENVAGRIHREISKFKNKEQDDENLAR